MSTEFFIPPGKQTEVLVNEEDALCFIYRAYVPEKYATQYYNDMMKFGPFVKYYTVNGRASFACGDLPVYKDENGKEEVKAKVHRYSNSSINLMDWGKAKPPESVNSPATSVDDILYRLRHMRDALSHDFKMVLNSSLVHRYSEGKDDIGYHGDKESIGAVNTVVATVSYGGSRDFYIKELATGEVIKSTLHQGDVVGMRGQQMQIKYHHSIPKRAKADCRISATYRFLSI